MEAGFFTRHERRDLFDARRRRRSSRRPVTPLDDADDSSRRPKQRRTNGAHVRVSPRKVGLRQSVARQRRQRQFAPIEKRRLCVVASRDQNRKRGNAGGVDRRIRRRRLHRRRRRQDAAPRGGVVGQKAARRVADVQTGSGFDGERRRRQNSAGCGEIEQHFKTGNCGLSQNENEEEIWRK